MRVYNAARTVVDLMRLRARIGEPVAHIALQRYLARRDARVGELVDLAHLLDVAGPVWSAVDVLTDLLKTLLAYFADETPTVPTGFSDGAVELQSLYGFEAA